MTNLIGQRFGKLIVIATAKRSPSYHKKWICMCDCGEQSEPRESSLKSGETKSCGSGVHYPANRKCKLLGDEASLNFHFRSYRSGAMKRKLDFSLSREEFKSLTKRPCEYCGSEPREYRQSDMRDDIKSYVGNGIDRVDSGRGYDIFNCVPCCTLCNSMKSDLSQTDFINQIQKISSYPKVV